MNFERTTLGLLFGGAMTLACGGSDSTIGDGGDTDSMSGNDTGSGSDSGMNVDTGTDGSNNDSGSDAGNFLVGNVNGLVLWLDAAKNVTLMTNTVITWGDQTTHKNDAKGIQNVGRNPTVTMAINNRPTIHFNKTGLNQNTGNMLSIPNNADTSLQWGTGDFYVAEVARFDNDPTAGTSSGVACLYQKLPFNMPQAAGVSLFGNVPNIANLTAADGFALSIATGSVASNAVAYHNNTAHIFVGKRTGTTIDARVDGASVGTAMAAQNVDNPNSGTTLGAAGDASIYRMNGDMAEVIAVKGTIAPADQAGIEAYLKAKYATP